MVEMMFAILILSVVLLGLVSVLGSILDNQYNSRAYDKVSIAANTVFGQARQALAEHFDRPLVPDVFPAGRQTLPNQTPKRPDLMQVDLVIHWTDKRGQEHHKSMSTKFLRVK
jgi:type II secretory pathway pseudopilin PulG